MKTSTIEELNKDFSIDDGKSNLRFKTGEGNIPVVEIQNAQANATISLQGAHILSWKPHSSDEVIWLSEDATFASGKSIRGGIPICWPWFGAHVSDTTYPAHGFARTVLWQVSETKMLSADETQITFRLVTNDVEASHFKLSIQEMWPLNTIAEYRVTISEKLSMQLTTFNHSDETMTIGQALHTYFKVDDVSKTHIDGLEGKSYLDKTDNFKTKVQNGAVTVSAEVDRIYLNTAAVVIIDDGKRKISIKQKGSLSTVVWNPWKEVANKMGDLGEAGYLKMLCVETANAADDVVNIKAGQSHTLAVTYEV